MAVSAAALFVRGAQTDAATIVWLRMTLAVAMLSPWAARELRAVKLSSRQRRLMVAGGVALGVHFLAWTASLALTSVAASVLLVSLHPVIVAPASRRLFGERAERGTLIGIALALAGTVITCAGGLRGGGGELGGDLLALLGAVALAVYLLIGRRVRAAQGTAAYSATVYAIVAVMGLVAAIVAGTTHMPSGRTFLFGLLLAAVCTVGGHTLFTWTLRSVTATTVSVAFLGEPPIAAVLALLFLHERPGIATVAGGVLILAGLFLTLRAERAGQRRRELSAGTG